MDTALVSKTTREISVNRWKMSEISVKYRFEILMNVKVHIVDICVMKFCNLLGGYKGLWRTNCPYLQGMRLSAWKDFIEFSHREIVQT
jgi:hypothetical protein